MEPRRFRDLPRAEVLGVVVPVAIGPAARLLGLALVCRDRAGAGLLIPRCRSVHTFGMRFPIDVFFLDCLGRPLRRVSGLPSRRIVACTGAAAVLEMPSAERVAGRPAG